MRNLIRQKLEEIEEKENVKIIYAAESGSRAWGFASCDSDYDVRFIYVRKPEYYLKLEKTKDVIEWQLDETLDINGWDLKKALRLLHKSNPTIFEWANSPVVYCSSPQWRKVEKIINMYFTSRAGYWHYLSMAKGNYREYLKGGEVKIKKYFYVLRPLHGGRRIAEKCAPSPMELERLVESQLDGSVKEEVLNLLSLKRNSKEYGSVKRIDSINRYIENQLLGLKGLADFLPERNYKSFEELDNIFVDIVFGRNAFQQACIV